MLLLLRLRERKHVDADPRGVAMSLLPDSKNGIGKATRFSISVLGAQQGDQEAPVEQNEIMYLDENPMAMHPYKPSPNAGKVGKFVRNYGNAALAYKQHQGKLIVKLNEAAAQNQVPWW